MKIPKDYKKVISTAAGKNKWYFLTKRGDIPPLSVWLKIVAFSYEPESKKLFGEAIPWSAYWSHTTRGFKKACEKMTKIIYTPTLLRRHLNRLDYLCQAARQEAKYFYDRELVVVKEKELLKHYQAVVKNYGLSFSYGFFTWCSQVLQKQAKEIIVSYEDKLKILNLDKDSALGILIVSEEKSLYRKKEEALDKLSNIYYLKIKELKIKNLQEVAKLLPALDKAIKDFLKKYQWVSYDYNGPTISYEEVLSAISSVRDGGVKNILNKEQIISKCKIKKSEQTVFEHLSLVSWAKDLRNTIDDFVHCSLDNLYREVGRRRGLEKIEVKYLWPEEFVDLLLNKQQFTHAYLKEKHDECLTFTLPKKVGVAEFYVGETAKKIAEKEFCLAVDKTDRTKPLKGTVASPGKVVGPVKIVQNFSEINKVESGDILVAYMTSPRFMPAIHRCAGIVTNDGGLTCHAAIIAREIKKPCIVGTKIATKVLHDGDMVEVDANKGVVRKL